MCVWEYACGGILMCSCVCTHLCMQKLIHTCMCIDQKLTLDAFKNFSPPYFLSEGLTGFGTSGIHLPLLSQGHDYRFASLNPDFHMGAGEFQLRSSYLGGKHSTK